MKSKEKNKPNWLLIYVGLQINDQQIQLNQYGQAQFNFEHPEQCKYIALPIYGYNQEMEGINNRFYRLSQTYQLLIDASNENKTLSLYISQTLKEKLMGFFKYVHFGRKINS
ncbi:hypothetical protein TTHERM_000660169 (macronuclear) [Tetrahymena thermophila SB210]|uniref:Uncharacterized protein n=1 Tax=Tetrahymena thermophila (strain SB210) TaxID=312017 RepID=W7XIM1_TETTS|nr:hypothetical protein TTHERM_000660169 [Tetrahymena thermophila SB210]EWS73414.1 hypothetical protein TTHERM_000660169 [Tetrahymena thermophila SB210]|eukprot:XP_012654066.1 hypothetical protein TTHERM_000660169 [Tetrahymena thermophila SB210]